MGYHHLADPASTTRELVGFLKPGGRLLVVDIVRRTEAVISAEFEGIVPHRYGFCGEEMREIFEAAELQGFEYKKVFSGRTPVRKGTQDQPSSDERAVDFFLAMGSKALA
jgi:SAM-dependent methyltransferase